MVLKGFELELGAVLCLESKSFFAPAMLVSILLDFMQVIIQQRRMTKGTLAIRTPVGIHLEQSQVHPQLDFFDSILADKPPHDDLARLVLPLVEDVRNIEIHYANINPSGRQ